MLYDPTIKPEVFAGKDETRPQLTSVQLDTEAKMLIATDGHRMLVTPVQDVEADHTGPLAPEVLVAARKCARQHGPTLGANGHVALPNGTTHLRKTQDDVGPFPPWQQVMPKGEPTAIVRVNGAYLASIAKAVGDKAVTIFVRGELDPIEFRVSGELGETVLIIMPMRR
jgi:DNA polymerase III sliding clamp (beta) subunit (PCNA family)